MNYRTTNERAVPPLVEHALAKTPASAARADIGTLAQLKNRLLREALKGFSGTPLARILRLAATEAEAQAWLTSFPLLTFPVLFDEKTEQVRRYAARQSRLRQRLHAARLRS